MKSNYWLRRTTSFHDRYDLSSNISLCSNSTGPVGSGLKHSFLRTMIKMKRMAYPASHFMNTSSEFVTIQSLNPNQSTLLTRVDRKEAVNIHTCKAPIHMAQYRSVEIRY